MPPPEQSPGFEVVKSASSARARVRKEGRLPFPSLSDQEPALGLKSPFKDEKELGEILSAQLAAKAMENEATGAMTEINRLAEKPVMEKLEYDERAYIQQAWEADRLKAGDDSAKPEDNYH